MKAIYRTIPLLIISFVGMITCSSNEVKPMYIFARDLIVPLIIIVLIVED